MAATQAETDSGAHGNGFSPGPGPLHDQRRHSVVEAILLGPSSVLLEDVGSAHDEHGRYRRLRSGCSKMGTDGLVLIGEFDHLERRGQVSARLAIGAGTVLADRSLQLGDLPGEATDGGVRLA